MGKIQTMTYNLFLEGVRSLKANYLCTMNTECYAREAKGTLI